jgi:hypothetical protein
MTTDLTAVARAIFHANGDEAAIGAALADVYDHQIPEVVEILNGMEARRVAYLDQAGAMVAEHGHVIQGVIGSEDSPWFAYSVGLWPRACAEFVVRGFGSETPGAANAVAEWVTSGRLALVPGVHEVDGLRVRVDPWTGDPGDFGMANRHHGRTDYPKVHVVLADNDGRLPGEPGCELAEHQMRGL